jgi:hypothetical protein
MDTPIPSAYLILAEHLEELEAAWLKLLEDDAALKASTKKQEQK